jgi:outer membrane cobalamin receptor
MSVFLPRLSRLSWCVWIALALILSGPARLAASLEPTPDSATLSGSVVDPAGAAVGGARLCLRTSRGIAAEAASDATGRFSFVSVPPGRYELVTVRDGFRAEPQVVEIDAGGTLTVKIALRLAAVAESLVVSASQIELPLSRVPGSVSVIGQGELRARQLRTAADMLRLIPGMGVASSGGPGAVTSVFPRGGESDYTLVLIDGVRQNSFGGGFDFAHLPLFDVESVEVVRGPQSAQYGSDAIGGVIHFHTRLGAKPSAAGLFEVGSRGTSRLAASTSGSAGGFGWGLGVERAASNGFDGLRSAEGEPVVNDDYRALSISLGAAWKMSARTSLRAVVQLGSNRRGNPGPFGSNPTGAFPGVDRVSRGMNDTGLASLSFNHDWNPGTGMNVQASYGDLRSTFISSFGDSTSRTRRASVHAQIDRTLSPALSGSVGLEALTERADSSVITGLTGPLPITRQVVGYFVEGRYQADSRLFASAGLRVEQIRRESLEADPLGWTPRPALASTTVISPNPKIAASYYVRTSDASRGNWTRVHASAGTGIRAPDAFEIAFTDNPNLRPERSRSIDAGLEQALLDGRVVVDLTGFANRYEDLIVAVGRALADYSHFRTDNIANARSSGIEVSGALRTSWGLDTRLAYTYLDTAVLAVDHSQGVAPAPFAVGDPLIRRPRHQASLDATFTRNRLTSFLRIGGRSRVLDVEPNYGAFGGLFHSPGFARADVGTSVRMASGVEVLARVENLLGRRYEDALGYPAPGRTFTLGVRLATGR